MKELGTTDDVDSWLAARSARQSHEDPKSYISRVRAHLQASKGAIIETCAQVTGFTASDVERLWVDQQRYLAFLPALIGRTMADGAVTGTRKHRQTLRRAPVGNSLICLPSNAPVPPLAMLAATSAAVGNTCVLAGPCSLAPLIRKLVACFDADDAIAYFSDSPRRLVNGGLWNFQHLYFMGNNSAYSSLAKACAEAGTSLTFEGQGNGLIYVSQSAVGQLEKIVRLLLEAKRFCNGRMCSAPNSLLVHSSVYQDFVDIWGGARPSYELPIQPLGLLSGETETWLKTQAVRDSDLRVPFPYLVKVDSPEKLPGSELYSPIAAVCPVENYDVAEREFTANRYRLQASYYGEDPQELKRFRRLSYARLCINVNPADQDPVAPWGNYGLSGDSRVETFVDKLTRTQLIESRQLKNLHT